MRSLRFSWPVAMLTLLLCLPLVVVITAPLHAPAPEWAHVRRNLLPGHLWETILLLGGTLAITLVLGVSTAWLVAACEFPLRNILRWALVLPLACPTYIAAYAYAALIGPTGSISIWRHERTGWRMDIMDLPGLCLVLAVVLYPYIYLGARAAFAAGMSSHLDAGRLLGVGDLSRFFRIALPLARPAISGGAVLVAMEVLNDYGAVKYFGIRTLTTGIFRSWAGLYDLGSALRIGLVLLVMIAMLLWIERRARGGSRHHVDQAPAARRRLTGAKAWAAPGWCLLVLIAGAVLPWSHLAADAMSFPLMTAIGEFLPALFATVGIASAAALITLLASLVLVYAERHGQGPAWMVQAAQLGYVIPGAVIAVGVMTVAGAIDRSQYLSVTLIGGTGLLVYAFTVRFLAVAGQPLAGAIRQQDPALDDAARLLGLSSLKIFFRVNLPILRPALLAAATLVAIEVVKELPLTLILRPFDLDTLSTRAFELARIEQLREASVPALLIVLCGVVPVLLLDRITARLRS